MESVQLLIPIEPKEFWLQLRTIVEEVVSSKGLEIPDHVDPPFRFMLTHHSGMLTHRISNQI